MARNDTTKMDLEKLLEEFGLDEKEAKTYLANLELGPAKVLAISKKSGVARVHTYNVLDQLVKKGLASRTYRKEKMLFVARDPEVMVHIMKNRAESFQKHLPELKALSKSEKMPAIRMFEGDEGLKAIYEDSLTAKDGILSWGNVTHLEESLPEYFHSYYKRRARKKIFIRSIVADSPEAREYQNQDSELCREIRLIPEERFNIVPECYIYDNKVAYMSIGERIGVIVESRDIADAQRGIFELAWERAAFT